MAQPMQDALSSLEDAVGDIDRFVMDELGYASQDELDDGLMGLQVDSVAAAIYQMKQGKGIVIADQTGIGKGRQAAAIIRWAERSGKTPVFVTMKDTLFSDMHGDLLDIGSDNITPLLMNIDSFVKTEAGGKLFANQANKHRKALETVAATGELPKGNNALFLTYSQINKPNTQRRVLSALAPNAIFILDESHNAGGEPVAPAAKPATAAPEKPVASSNTIFTDEAADEARAFIKSMLNGSQLNSGVDPRLFQAGITLAGYHIEKGARSFAAFAKAMLADMGDGVRPYLKQWYMGVKYDPRASSL